MSPRDDSGPAFPRITQIQSPHTIGHLRPEYSKVITDDGMTLRDYFAAKALPVVASGARIVGDDFLDADQYEVAARYAYELADAMLKARKA